MPITEQQRIERRNHIGSSDMAAILGVDPFKSAYDVWLDKTGKLEQRPASDEMDDGNALEDRLLTWSEKTLGRLVRNEHAIVKNFPIAANIDGVRIDTSEPVEAKTTGFNGMPISGIGEPGTDQIPDHWIIQGHVHMMAMDAGCCHYPVWIGGRGKFLYFVERHPLIVERIEAASVAFWDNIRKDIPPDNSTPSLEVVKYMRREPGKVIDIPSDIVARWDEARAVRLDAEKTEKQIEAELLAAISDAEGANCELGKITYMEQKRKSYVVPESKFRVLRFKKLKG